MSPKNVLFFLFCAAAAFPSCHKSGGSSSGPTIYTAGEWGNTTYNVAAYWVNNRLVSLTDTLHVSFARAVYATGNDVYVAGTIGTIGNANSNIPVYWKNGQEVRLDSANFDAIANAIVVANGNVYVAGEDYGYAAFWINGQGSIVNGAFVSSAISSMAVSGTDVYLLGIDSLRNPCFWKNGQLTELQGANISASAIAVEGNDVYIAGQQIDTITNNWKAVLWKNGILTSLSDGSLDVLINSIAVDDTDVYISGNTQVAGSGYRASVWKNGQLLSLAAGSSDLLYGWGVAAVNGAVYVGGNVSAPGQVIAAYWSANGVVELDKNPAQSSTVWGIFVK